MEQGRWVVDLQCPSEDTGLEEKVFVDSET